MHLNTAEKIGIVLLIIEVFLICSFGFVLLGYSGVIDMSNAAHTYYDVVGPISNPEYREIAPNVFTTKELGKEQEEILVRVIQDKIDNAPLYQNDYYIVLTDDELTSGATYAKGGNVVATTDGTNKIININFGYIYYSLTHELGHAVDRTYGFSETEEFLSLYDRETDRDYYFNRHPAEYFANGYDMYVNGRLTDEELLKYFNKITNNSEVNE